MVENTKLAIGDRIGLLHIYGGRNDYTVEEFRQCLGVFLSEQHREAGDFTPLCVLWESGPGSKEKYICNYGGYQTNMVPKWMNLPTTKEGK